MCKKKILMVHNFYQIGGGEDSVFKNEIELLRENGHEVIEYTCNNDELKRSKLKLFLLPFTTIWSFKTYREVRKIIKEKNIEIVHCHNTFPLISPSIYYAARSKKIPVVQTIHNFRLLCPCGIFYRDGHICEECLERNSFKPALKHKCYRNSKIQTLVVSVMLSIHRKLGTYNKINYIFLTEFNKKKFDQLIDINGDNVFVKPNFVKDTMKIKAKSDINKTFVFAGRLEENKGIKFLLGQWEKMSEKYKLHIYGVGPLEKYVKERVQNSHNILYLGFCTRAEIFEDMSKSMAMIFPSLWYEGYPMTIADSMAIGCPVVSSNVGNAANIIRKSKGGMIYDSNKKDDFINVIETVIKNNDELRKNSSLYYSKILSRDKNYITQIGIYKKHKGWGLDKKPKVFLFYGRLEENKGILSLLKMWMQLPKDYILHIYGAGSFQEYVESVAQENENIMFYGFKPQDVIFRDVFKCIAVVIPSEWYETFGMAIPESFSLATPVISTDLGNLKLMIEESKGGITYKMDDMKSFCHALDEVIINNTYYKKNAFKYYEEKLRDKENYHSLNDIYNKVR